MRIALGSGTAAEVAGRPGARGPAVVMIPDIMGLRPLFDDHVATLAERIDGPVIAIEPWPGREDLSLGERLDSMATLSDERLLGDAAAAADHLAASYPEATPAVICGFCMGGMFTFKAAGTGRFTRAAAFYGMITLPDGWKGPAVAEPLDWLDRPGRCPTLAIIGSDDQFTPPADVAALAERPDVEVVSYDGAEHGFVHDPERPAHRPDDADDAWGRVVEFLRG